MNLQEAFIRCQSEHFNYPEILNSEFGLHEVTELDVIGIPSWNRNNSKNKRKAILEIRTWMGISSNAIHFYGKIIADGVYQATLSNPKKPRSLSFEEEQNHPLLNYHYELKIKRLLTKEEIESDPKRWGDCYDEGDLVEGYEKIDELINDAKEIFNLRFIGDWDFYVQYPRGNKEKITFQRS